MTALRIMGLFAGVGGLEKGLELAGHESHVLCEIDPAAQMVLERRFPDAFIHDDVTTVTCVPRGVDLLTAGFPCQDLSQAGRMAGIHGRNSGLVEHVFSILESEPGPRWVLLENVPNMLRLHGGSAMRYIVRRLEGLRFSWAYRVVDTRAFGLPQRRRRVFLLASRDCDPAPVLLGQTAPPSWLEDDHELDASAYGFYWTEGNTGLGWSKESVPPLKGGSGLHIPSSPGIWLRRRSGRGPRIVTPGIRDAERLQGFPVGWTDLGSAFPLRRRWRLVGNAVSVPVARWLGKRLMTPTAFSKVLGTPYTEGPLPAAGYGSRGRWFSVDASAAPVRKRQRLLSDFIDIEAAEPLSLKATAGFLDRLTKSTLRAPMAFKEALAAHVRQHERRRGTSR